MTRAVKRSVSSVKMSVMLILFVSVDKFFTALAYLVIGFGVVVGVGCGADGGRVGVGFGFEVVVVFGFVITEM